MFCVIEIVASLTPHQIAIEYCDAGSCLDIIKKQHRPFNEKQIRCVMKQVVQGVAYIHGLKPPICHRDIKAGNILLNARGEAKLGMLSQTKLADPYLTSTHPLWCFTSLFFFFFLLLNLLFLPLRVRMRFWLRLTYSSRLWNICADYCHDAKA
jgi:serine/threonine protein kinase